MQFCTFMLLRGAAKDQWICLHLTSWCLGFESPAHHLHFHQCIKLCNMKKTKINKKRPWFAHFFKKTQQLYTFMLQRKKERKKTLILKKKIKSTQNFANFVRSRNRVLWSGRHNEGKKICFKLKLTKIDFSVTIYFLMKQKCGWLGIFYQNRLSSSLLLQTIPELLTESSHTGP